MRATSKVVALMVAIRLGAVAPLVDLESGRAQQEAAPARSARGGNLIRTAHYRFEVFSYTTGVRIFVTDPAGAALNASALSGTATFYHPNSPRPWFTRPLRPAPAQPGRPAESLDLTIDLATVPRSGATMTLEIAGLPDSKESTAKFTMPFRLVDSGPGTAQAGRAANPVRRNTGPAPPIHYYATAGFYRTTTDIVVWVPAAGYYYDIPTQSHLRAHPNAATGWQPARAAPAPAGPVTPQARRNPSTVHTELYWHPKAWHGTAEHEALMKAQMRQQQP